MDVVAGGHPQPPSETEGGARQVALDCVPPIGVSPSPFRRNLIDDPDYADFVKTEEFSDLGKWTAERAK